MAVIRSSRHGRKKAVVRSGGTRSVTIGLEGKDWQRGTGAMLRSQRMKTWGAASSRRVVGAKVGRTIPASLYANYSAHNRHVILSGLGTRSARAAFNRLHPRGKGGKFVKKGG